MYEVFTSSFIFALAKKGWRFKTEIIPISGTKILPDKSTLNLKSSFTLPDNNSSNSSLKLIM